MRPDLRPVGLAYFVKDDALTIDSRGAVTEARVEDLERKPDRMPEDLRRPEQSR